MSVFLNVHHYSIWKTIWHTDMMMNKIPNQSKISISNTENATVNDLSSV
jgi:hypothetical protein